MVYLKTGEPAPRTTNRGCRYRTTFSAIAAKTEIARKPQAAPKQRSRVSLPQKAKSRLETRRAESAAAVRITGLKGARKAKAKKQARKRKQQVTKAKVANHMRAARHLRAAKDQQTGTGKATRKRSASEACASESRRKSQRHMSVPLI